MSGRRSSSRRGDVRQHLLDIRPVPGIAVGDPAELLREVRGRRHHPVRVHGSILKGGKGHHGHHAASTSSESDKSNSDPFSQALQGASSTSVTNSDGSVTTSLTYADGSKVSMTSAAGKSSSTSAASSYNFIEQMIQRQAQAISSGATSSLSVSV